MAPNDLNEFKQAGEKYIVEWLTENGYVNIKKETLQPGEYGFIANSGIGNILVQAKFFLHPHKPYKLSDFELDLLSRRALKLGAVAYTAYLVMDEEGKLMKNIMWERLP